MKKHKLQSIFGFIMVLSGILHLSNVLIYRPFGYSVGIMLSVAAIMSMLGGLQLIFGDNVVKNRKDAFAVIWILAILILFLFLSCHAVCYFNLDYFIVVWISIILFVLLCILFH
jgi:hypothetical protein